MRRIFAGLLVTLFASFCFPISYGGCSTKWSSIVPEESRHAQEPESDLYARLREKMVREQLQARDIRDSRVIASMLKVPRHEFVPENLVQAAYEDNALPLSMRQTISQPYIVAYMTQALKLRGTEKVLEIGTGSGYQAAVLAEIVPDVYTIEILPELQAKAQVILAKLGYRNIHSRTGDGYMGWPEAAPFDCIIVTAAPSKVPQPLLDQLKEGGRLVIPIGEMNQDLVVYEKRPDGMARKTLIPVRFVPMTGKAEKND